MKNLLRKWFNWLVRPWVPEGRFRFAGSTLLQSLKNTGNPMFNSIVASIAKTEKQEDFTALELVHFEFWIEFKKNRKG